MRKCKYCNSIWVCWNWCHAELEWYHECWSCENVQTTNKKVRNGLSYFLLVNCYEFWKKIIK